MKISKGSGSFNGTWISESEISYPIEDRLMKFNLLTGQESVLFKNDFLVLYLLLYYWKVFYGRWFDSW